MLPSLSRLCPGLGLSSPFALPPRSDVSYTGTSLLSLASLASLLAGDPSLPPLSPLAPRPLSTLPPLSLPPRVLLGLSSEAPLPLLSPCE
eukprot:3602409-Rhodomonas_salina.1